MAIINEFGEILRPEGAGQEKVPSQEEIAHEDKTNEKPKPFIEEHSEAGDFKEGEDPLSKKQREIREKLLEEKDLSNDK